MYIPENAISKFYELMTTKTLTNSLVNKKQRTDLLELWFDDGSLIECRIARSFNDNWAPKLFIIATYRPDSTIDQEFTFNLANKG